MRLDRSLNIRNAAKMSLAALYRSAAAYGHSSESVNAEVSRLYAGDVAKAPGWVRAYLDGYRQALSDALNCVAGQIVYGGFWRGAFISTSRDRPDYYEKRGVDPAAFAGKSDAGEIEALGLYWGHFDRPRVWFIGEQPREIRARLEA